VELRTAVSQELLDGEWASLIMEARTVGLSVEEIRQILKDLQAARNLVWRIDEAVV
jgi:DNA-binding transcriptional MerR regulator